MSLSFTEALADFAVQDSPPDLKPYALYFLNWLAVTYAGASERAVSILCETEAEESPGTRTPLGRSERLSLSACAKADCFSSAIQAYDDIHFATTAHPCGPVAAALLAAARKQTVSLQEFLEALAIGMETECRCAEVLFENGSGGWYTTGLAGTIGAAAGTGRLLKADVQAMRNVLGLAASYACGTRGTHGSMTGSLPPAIAAENGYRAAVLGVKGFTCSSGALDGPNGLVACISGQASDAERFMRYGGEYISLQTSCKPYPCGFISFALIGCLQEKKDRGVIREVICRVSPRCASLGKKPFPSTMYEGFVSLPWIAAKALKDPESLRKPFPETIVISEEEKELIGKIRIEADPQLDDDSAAVTVISDRMTETMTCASPAGSSKHPMAPEDVLRKVRNLGTVEETLIRQLLDAESYSTYFIRITDRISLEKK